MILYDNILVARHPRKNHNQANAIPGLNRGMTGSKVG